MKFISLFAGIGGFDLGLERAGMACVAQVEKNEWCQKVLAKHWPNVIRYGDIKNVKGQDLPAVDLICGGFPCQPFSHAGKRKGKDDDRYLWPETIRIIKELKPRWFIGENVAGIINLALDQVLSDLEGAGYTCQTFVIPACAVNAPHRRDRVWIMGYTDDYGRATAEITKSAKQGDDRNAPREKKTRKSTGSSVEYGKLEVVSNADGENNEKRRINKQRRDAMGRFIKTTQQKKQAGR